MKINSIIAGALSLGILLTTAACGSKDSSDFDFSAGLDENGFFEGIKASDYITLEPYKGIEISEDIFVASEDEVQVQLDNVLESYGTYEELTTGTVKDGDTLNIDYVGSVDGVEFDGGSTGGMGTTVTIGVTSYIDGFLDQLIGHKPGENFDINVTFPDPYENNPDLAGKPAVFNITINYIQGDFIEAELTDEIAASYGFETVDAMLEDIRAWVVQRQKSDIVSNILTLSTASEIPQAVLDYVIDYDMYQLESSAAMYGLTGEQMLTTLYGYESLDAYKEENMEAYRENAKIYLAAQAIAELEGIVVTAEDITAAGYGEDVVKEYGEPYLKQFILMEEKLTEFIIDNAKVK